MANVVDRKFLDLANINEWTREEAVANAILGILLDHALYSDVTWDYLMRTEVSGQKPTRNEALGALEKLIENGLIRMSFDTKFNVLLETAEKRSGT